MELSENQLNRSSRISRLPGPSAPSGLSELSESQHNTRSQSAIPAPGGIKNLKRETPQPASQSEPKRKLLSDRAAEYPPKATHSYATRANVVQGHALTSVPSLKSSYRQQPGQTALLGSFAKSFGPGRDRPAAKTNAIRPPTSRLKHVPRPKTSHGHRDEDLLDQSTTTNGMMSLRSQDMFEAQESPHPKYKRSTTAMIYPRKTRESSLSQAFDALNIQDPVLAGRVTPPAPNHSAEDV